jgi:hypothetical protein
MQLIVNHNSVSNIHASNVDRQSTAAVDRDPGVSATHRPYHRSHLQLGRLKLTDRELNICSEIGSESFETTDENFAWVDAKTSH